MYNEELKLAWMEDAERREALSNRRVAIVHMNRLAVAVEERLGEDIFNLIRDGRKEEVIGIGSENLRFTTYATIRRFLNTVNAYVIWRFAVDESSVAAPSQRLTAYDFSLVPTYKNYFIRTEDELSGALSHRDVAEGDLLPVCAALAWCGYEPAEMVNIQQNEVSDRGDRIAIRGKLIQPGYVNSTLLYYLRHDVYYRGVRSTEYVKEIGSAFLRNIVVRDSKKKPINMVERIRNMPLRFQVAKTEAPLSYQQLIQAGEFQRMIAQEQIGTVIDREFIQHEFGLKNLAIQDRLYEFEAFKKSFW